MPAGSVGLAGTFTGIYPTASPGGWRLVGRTTLVLWDPDRDPPATLPPGTRVQVRAGMRSLTVHDAGPLTTVQDAGRPGWAHLGVPRAGALDRPAADLANRLVGNDTAAAVLETTLGGVTFAVSAAMSVAVTGAECVVSVSGRAAPFAEPVSVPAGATVRVGHAVRGVRSYVAVGGGVDVVAGARLPVDRHAGARGPPGAACRGRAAGRPGDRVPVAAPTSGRCARTRDRPCCGCTPARGRTGSTGSALATLTCDVVRRDGGLEPGRAAARRAEPLTRCADGELPSEGIVLGAVQVPPSGQPLVFLHDHPTTGGYPVVGVVDPDDLWQCAQLRPGERVRFTRP